MGLLDLSCFYMIYAVKCDNAVEKCYDEKNRVMSFISQNKFLTLPQFCFRCSVCDL